MAVALTTTSMRTGVAEPSDPSAEATSLRHCLIEYEHNTMVGSPVDSVIRECSVQPGERVKAGQTLGFLQDDDMRAEVRLREAEASSDIDVRLSQARNAEAVGKMQRTAALLRRNATSQADLAQHQLEAAATALEVERAKHRRVMASFELEKARAELRSRELVSPHDGIVAAVIKRKGEAVATRDPIFQVVNTEILRVVGLVDVSEVWRLEVGQPVRIIPDVAGVDLPVEHEVFAGRIVFIDSQIDLLTRTSKIHVRAENRGGLLRAGFEARMEIHRVATPPEAPQDPPRAARASIGK